MLRLYLLYLLAVSSIFCDNKTCTSSNCQLPSCQCPTSNGNPTSLDLADLPQFVNIDF